MCDTDCTIKALIAAHGFTGAAEGTGGLLHIVLLNMDPGHKLRPIIRAPADNSSAGALQVRDDYIIFLFYVVPEQGSGGEQLHDMAVAGNHPCMPVEQPHFRREKLLIDAAAEQGQNGDVKPAFIHVIDQIDQDLFRAAVA